MKKNDFVIEVALRLVSSRDTDMVSIAAMARQLADELFREPVSNSSYTDPVDVIADAIDGKECEQRWKDQMHGKPTRKPN